MHFELGHIRRFNCHQCSPARFRIIGARFAGRTSCAPTIAMPIPSDGASSFDLVALANGLIMRRRRSTVTPFTRSPPISGCQVDFDEVNIR